MITVEPVRVVGRRNTTVLFVASLRRVNMYDFSGTQSPRTWLETVFYTREYTYRNRSEQPFLMTRKSCRSVYGNGVMYLLKLIYDLRALVTTWP